MKKFSFVLSGVIVAFIASIGINATTVPYNMYVEPGTNTCLVTWEDDDNSAWNLRYRLFTDDPEEPVLLHSLDGTTYTGSYADITLPAPWGGVNMRGGQGAIYFKNQSTGYPTDGSLTYTIPEGYTNANFTFTLKTASTSYGSGNFTVSTPQTAAVGHTFTRGETFSWQVVASSGEKITVTSTDASYSPDIALVAVYYVPTKEWTYVNNLDKMEYTIEDLEMSTDYEVQVQAIGDDGTLSDWTRADVFTTLDEEPIIPSVHIMGEVDDQVWASDAGTKMAYDPETELYTATVHVGADKTFGFSTEIDADGDLGGWSYVNLYRFGPECDGVGPFDLTEERLGQEITLGWGLDNCTDVHVLTEGDYEITVSLEQNYVVIGKLAEPEHGFDPGDVNHDGKLSIADVTLLINYLLTDDPSNVCLICCDVNGDNKIAIGDVTALINLLLTQGE